MLGQAVAQPVAGHAQHFDVLGEQTQLFLQLAETGLLRGFATLDPALRELPGLLADALRPKDPRPAIDRHAEHDDADIGAEAIGVDHVHVPVICLHLSTARRRAAITGDGESPGRCYPAAP